MRPSRKAIAVCLALLIGPATALGAEIKTSIRVRDRNVSAYLSGPESGEPALVLSGDGGWIHLGPAVARSLAQRGYHVTGIDVRDYLSRFTEGKKTLSEADVPGDLRQMIAAAGRKPIVIGVSEGAGLAVLAATDDQIKAAVRGVVGLGLGDTNELAWHFRDTIIYFTKRDPNEPSFKVSAHIGRVTPLPLAAIHATGDEFVPVAEIQQLMARAKEPKRLWIVPAADHRFSDNQKAFQARLDEALSWIKDVAAAPASGR